MTITVDMMKAAANSGLSVVCSSCELYWDARGKGIVGDACLALSNCGSPFAGGNFHEYRGVMTEEVFRRCCFVCGEPSVKSVQKGGQGRVLGLCATHFEWMQDPAMRGPRPVQPTTRPEKNYLNVDASDLKGVKLPPEKSLLGQMLKTEKEWADEDSVEFRPLELMGVEPDDGGA
jgi:hypothetical protein